MLPAVYLASAEGLELAFKSWPAFAAHLAQLYDEKTWHRAAIGWRELAFGSKAEPDFPAPELKAGLPLRGKIDSIDRLPHQRVSREPSRSFLRVAARPPSKIRWEY